MNILQLRKHENLSSEQPCVFKMFRKAVLNEEIDFWCRNLQLCPYLFHLYHMTKKVCRFRHQKSISSFKTALRNILQTQGCSDNKCSCFHSCKIFIHLVSNKLIQNFSTRHILSLWSCDSSCNWMRPTLDFWYQNLQLCPCLFHLYLYRPGTSTKPSFIWLF